MTTMDTGARAWLLKTAKDNYWRISEWYDLNDLIQDGHVCWWRVVMKYETRLHRIRPRKHIMALFMRTYSNHIHDLSKGETRRPKEVRILDAIKPTRGAPLQNEYNAWQALERECDASEFDRLVAEAPAILRSLLRVILADGQSPRLRAQFRIGSDGERETTNQRLCKLIGANPDEYDYATALRSYLHAA